MKRLRLCQRQAFCRYADLGFVYFFINDVILTTLDLLPLGRPLRAMAFVSFSPVMLTENGPSLLPSGKVDAGISKREVLC